MLVASTSRSAPMSGSGVPDRSRCVSNTAKLPLRMVTSAVPNPNPVRNCGFALDPLPLMKNDVRWWTTGVDHVYVVVLPPLSGPEENHDVVKSPSTLSD